MRLPLFRELVVFLIFLGFSVFALANIALSGSVGTTGTDPICSQSGTSSGSTTASINVSCSVGFVYAFAQGGANLSTGYLYAGVETGPFQGGFFEDHLTLDQNYLVTGSSGIVGIGITAGARESDSTTFTLIFDGQTLAGAGPNNFFFTFDVTPGDIYNLQLSADISGGDDNGNTSSGSFQYMFDPALVPVSPIPGSGSV